MTARFLEDFTEGQKFASGQLKVDRERITSFASEFDPQPFHLNEATLNQRAEPVQVSVVNLIVPRRSPSTA
jgi:acyl dehydratase